MVTWKFWLFRAKSGSFFGANVWRRVIIVDAGFRDMKRLVLFCLVGKWVQVFDEERSKAKNLLKIRKAVVSCAREDQTGSKAQDQIALSWQRNRHVGIGYWFQIWCLERKQSISKHLPRWALRDKFQQIPFLYWGYLERGKTIRSGIDISRIEHRRKIYTFEDFKFLINLYYTSRTSSKRNTAKSFKHMIFIRGDCQKGANQLIYYNFAILLKPGLCITSSVIFLTNLKLG